LPSVKSGQRCSGEVVTLGLLWLLVKHGGG